MARERSEMNPTDRPLPHCKAMLLCEEVEEDPFSGRLSLVNLVDAFEIEEFPGPSGAFVVYIQLYDGIGRYHLTIEANDLADDRSVGRTAIVDLEFPERLAKIEIIVPIDAAWLPRPGRYELILLADEQELSRQYFVAEEPNGEEEE